MSFDLFLSALFTGIPSVDACDEMDGVEPTYTYMGCVINQPY